jgi:squalene-hopene/tetraprenyl-beta-curcumene cyclase
VLEALHDAGVDPNDAVFRKAEVFLGRCRARGSGFFFSTVIVDGNKAGKEGDTYRSYGTATADGLLSLLALGARPDNPRVTAARSWLVSHHRTDFVPGFPDGLESDWRTGMFFYYAAAGARLGLATALVDRQRADGSFRNSSFLMKEDDPLIATGFAVTALAAGRN